MSISTEFTKALHLRKAFVGAGYTLLVYEFLLTIDDELQYIWRAPWTVVKATFIANRYLNLVVHTVIALEEFNIIGHGAQSFCKRFYLASWVVIIVSVESMHIFVITRAWAIWGCQQRMAIRLAAAYAVYIGTLIGVGTYLMNTQILPTMQAGQSICISDTMSYIWLTRLASILLHTIVFILIMWSLRKHSRLRNQFFLSTVDRLLSQDAIIFLVVHIFTSIFSIATLVVFSTDPKNFLARAFAYPVLAATGQRLVLNLRGLHRQSPDSSDLDREVDRQLKALEGADFWNEDNAPRPLQARSITEGSRESIGETACDSENLGPRRSQNGDMDKHDEIESVDIAVEDRV
ncbi:hypothetical protein BDN67DRAFT_1015542 [Paxillus ammoniavirescens]|nr:hypothetical protein BDN67DRAFT_1015542 [Paxillus ammoniavirescens]